MADKLDNYTIYKLCHKSDKSKDVYVGSSKQPIETRITKHRSDCYNTNKPSFNYKVYKHIRENGGFDDWQYTILEICDSITKKQARIAERKHMNDLNAKLNTYRPHRTQAEIKAECDHRNKIFQEANKDYFKNYRLDNLEKMNTIVKCRCGGTYSYTNKCHHRRTRRHKRYMESQEIHEIQILNEIQENNN